MLRGLIAGALVVTSAAPAHAQFGGPQKSTVREGFVLPAGNTRILVFRPDVSVGAQTTGGMNEPNAQWTQTARANMLAALDRARGLQGSTLVMVPELEGERGALVADYTALFKAVAIAAFNHKMFPGNRLPTKRGVFDWTLGEGAGALKSLGGDYGLFFYTYDSYGSTGRKIAQVVGLLMGVGLIPAGVHVGYAGLVDLKTGDLVWLNADLGIGGDPRTVEGADKRVSQLLDDFPGKRPGGLMAPSGTVKVDVPPETPTPEKKR
jgi:hypothetical protein